jgi:hypothetical protein
MDDAFELDDARTARDRVRALAQRHELILKAFWDGQRSTFGQYGPDERIDHVTTACTCVLSFLDVPGGKLPAYVSSSTGGFIDWLLGAKWSSEELPDPNVYTAPIALTALRLLEPGKLLIERSEQQVTYLVNELERTGTGICFQRYPPNGFLTYWTIRALWDVVETYSSTKWKDKNDETNRARELINSAVGWAEDEVWRHFSYFAMNDLDRFDPLQMAYSMALVDLSREKTARKPDETMVAKGLEILFQSQLVNGLWAKVFPIFHYEGYGSVYPFAFETLTAVMRIAFRQSRPEIPRHSVELFGPHVRGLLRTLAWAEANEINAHGVTGWRSNVVPGDRPQAWATATVLSFSRSLDFLLGQVMRERLLMEFDTERFPRLGSADATADDWTNLADSETLVDGVRTSLKVLVFERLVKPHSEDQDPRGRIWSAIFFGPPGTAKSTLAREIAKFLGWPLITVQTSDFLALGTDRMAPQARLIFRKLGELSETVVLIDEVEEFVRDRGRADGEGRLITTAMLTLLQDLHEKQAVILIMATNRIDEFDPAIRRPGRFDLVLYVPPPSFEVKRSLLIRALTAAGISLPQATDDLLGEPHNLAVVERSTFDEWTRFTAICRDAAREASQLDPSMLAQLLDKYGSSLTINQPDWDKWRQKGTNIYV